MIKELGDVRKDKTDGTMVIVPRVSDILYQNSLHAEDKGRLTTEAENVALWVFDVEVSRSPLGSC